MKILCVTQRFNPAIGGAEQVAERFMDFLSTRHEVTVYTTNALELDAFWKSDGIKVKDETQKDYVVKRFDVVIPSKIGQNLHNSPFSYGMPGPFSPLMWNEILKTGNLYDLIIASGFPYNHVIPAYLVSKMYKKPIISIPHIHLKFPEIYLTGFRLALLDSSDAIVVNTLKEKESLIQYKILEKKINVISPSIDPSSWQTSDGANLRSELGLDLSSIIVLFAGLTSPEKGIIDLIDAIKKLLDKNNKIHLLIIGPSTSSFTNYLNKQNEHTKKNIHYLGTVSESKKKHIFNSVDIVALPSISESFGIIFLEGWICKKPVIGCRIEAVQELISDEIDGFLVNFGDVEELSTTIEKMINDPDLRKRLGNNGYQKVISKYDMKRNLSSFESLCLSVVRK